MAAICLGLNELMQCCNRVVHTHIDGLVQYCSNSSVLAMELLQFCANPSVL